MISQVILDSLGEGERKVVESAILSLANSGVIQKQKELNYQSILHGSDSEDPSELSERIIEYRRRNVGLDSILELAKRVAGEVR